MKTHMSLFVIRDFSSRIVIARSALCDEAISKE
jgi:hypothetical protein